MQMQGGRYGIRKETTAPDCGEEQPVSGLIGLFVLYETDHIVYL